MATRPRSIEYLNENDIVIRRVIDGGYERISGTLPLLITVTDTAANPRPYSAKRLMFWKKGKIDSGFKSEEERQALSRRGLLIPVVNFEKLDCPAEICGFELDCPAEICGFVGSPTQIKRVESVRLTPRNHRYFDASDQGIRKLMKELTSEHII